MSPPDVSGGKHQEGGLSAGHLEYLRGAAIRDEVAAAVAQSEPEGILFCHVGYGGRVLEQRRPDHPSPDGPKYLTASGEPLLLPVPPGMRDRAADPSASLVIVEGTKQHLAAASWAPDGYAVVGLLGCYGYRSRTSGVVDCIHDLPLEGREVLVLLDADVSTNRTVYDAAADLAEVLTVMAGADCVRFVRLPGATGADGADDWLARIPEDRRTQALARALRAAKPLDELCPRPPDRKPRTKPAEATVSDGYGVQGLQEGSTKSAALGRRMARDWAGRFIYVPRIGWHEWDGHKWELTTHEHVVSVAATWAEQLIVTAITDKAPGGLIREYLRYREVGPLRALVDGAKTAPALLVDADQLDAHPTLLNCPNGVVDLTTGELSPSDPALYLTRSTGAEYRPGFTHADWTQALEALEPGPREFMQCRLGQALYGFPPPSDEVVLCDGGGSNGKTTILGTVRAVMGTYGVLVSERVIMGSADQHPTEFMDFRGARFAYMEETPEARRLDVMRLKRIVGCGQMKARLIGKDSVEFPETHSLFISTNYRPVVDETDHGTWRRLKRVTFPYTYRSPGEPMSSPNDKPGDPGLRERARTADSEAQRAALAWMVDGAVAHHQAGRTFPAPPAEVAEATHEWRREADMILGYMEDRLIVDPAACIVATVLLDNFNTWLQAHNHRPWSATTLATRLGGHSHAARYGIVKEVTRDHSGVSWPPRDGRYLNPTVPQRGTVWRGVRFRTEADDKAAGKGGKGVPEGSRENTISESSELALPPLPLEPSTDEGASVHLIEGCDYGYRNPGDGRCMACYPPVRPVVSHGTCNQCVREDVGLCNGLCLNCLREEVTV